MCQGYELALDLFKVTLFSSMINQHQMSIWENVQNCSDHLKQIQVTRIKPIKHLPHFDDFNWPTMTTMAAPASATAMSERRFLLLMILARSLNASGLGLLFSASTNLLYQLTHSGRVAPVWRLWHFGSTAPDRTKDSKSIQTRKGDWEHVVYLSSHLVYVVW